MRSASDRAVRVRAAAGDADLETVRALFREYEAQVDSNLCFQGFAQELAALPGAYVPPRGGLYLAESRGEAVGCVALRPLADGRAEMKRLYVRPEARALGAGRALVEMVIAAARAAGHRALVLDTLPSMVAAQALYERIGFRDIAPYMADPVPGARCLGLALG